MNSDLNAILEGVIEKKVEKLSELDITDPLHSAVTEDIKKLIDASVAFDKMDVEYTKKDDERVIEKEKLALERMKMKSEENEKKFRRAIEENRLKHEKRKDVVDSILKGFGTAASVAAFVLSLGFETENSVSGQAARKGMSAAWDGVFKK